MELIDGSELKRFFRARRKLNSAGTISHLTQRAAGADLLFHENDDYLEFLRRMKDVAETYKLEILSFVCMPNHVHVQLRQSENNLPDAMRELFSRFARRQNSKYQRKGHLFGGPYRQAVCFDPLYALSVSLYIHLNPVRAKLIKDPRKYRWSSCSLYCQIDEVESFLHPKHILDYLSEDGTKAVQRYKKLLLEGVKIKADDVLEDQEAIHRFEGQISELPVFKSIIRFFMKTKINKEIIPEHDFIDLMHALVEKRPVQLPKDRAACKYLVEQLLSRGYTRTDIAKRLSISRKTVYNLMKNPLPISGHTGFG